MRLLVIFIAFYLLYAAAIFFKVEHDKQALRDAIATSMNTCKTAPPGHWIPYKP